MIPIHAGSRSRETPGVRREIVGLSGRLRLIATGDQEWPPDRDGKRLVAERAAFEGRRPRARQQAST